MSSQQSAAKRHDLLLSASTIACHANAHDQGFRQRDLRRMIEFSVNWAYPEFDEGGIPVENTQIRRYLDQLVSEGFARKSRAKMPRYSLTRMGLIELVSCMVNRRYFYNKDEFFYLYYIVRDYQRGLKRIIEREGARLSYGSRLELAELFNSKAVLENQLFYSEQELKKLGQRMQDQTNIARFAKSFIDENLPYEELTKEVDRRFPYCFNGAIPLSQFVKNVTPRRIIWELCVGSVKRRDHVWKPAYEALELHVAQLKRLLKEELGTQDNE